MESIPVEYSNTFYDSSVGSIFTEIDGVNVPIFALNKDYIKDVYVDKIGVNFSLVDNYDPEIDAYSAIITLPHFDSDMNPISWSLTRSTSQTYSKQPNVVITSSAPNTPPFYLDFPRNSTIPEEWNKIAFLRATGSVTINGKKRIPRVTGVSDSDEAIELFLNYEYSHNHIALIGNNYNNPNHLKETKIGQPLVKYKTFTDPNITSPEGFDWSSDGFKSFIVDNGTNAIYEFAVDSNATPYTIKTLKSTNNQYNFNTSQISDPSDIVFNSTGNIVHISDNSKRKISQFELSTPWDILTTNFNASYFENTNIDKDSFVSNDGNWYYTLDNSNNIHSYKLRIPYRISTSEHYHSEVIGDYRQVIEIPGYPSWRQRAYCNAVAFIKTLVYYNENGSYTVNRWYTRYTHYARQKAMCFSSDGMYMYVITGMAFNQGEIKRYDLSTPWDLSTAALSQTILHEIGVAPSRGDCPAAGYRDEGVVGVRISDDGSSLYILNTSASTVYRYTFNTGHEYDLTNLNTALGMNVAEQDVIIPPFGSNHQSLEIKDDRLYIANTTKIRQYNILNDDISTISLEDSSDYVQQNYSLSAIMKLEDSNYNRLYLQGNGIIYEYDIDSNLNTATFEYPLNDKELYFNHPISAFYMSDDNKKVYTLDNSANRILKYERQDSTLIGDLIATGDSYSIPSIYGTNWETLEIEETASKLYLGSNGIVQQFGFDSNLNLSYEKLLVLTGNTRSIEDIQFNDSGNTILILGKNGVSVDEYSTAIPYEVAG